MYVNLLLLVGVELDLDTLDASMALHGCCSLSSTAHSRSASLRCVFDPSSPEARFLPSQGPGQSMCALVLRGLCKSWTSGLATADFWLHDICSDCSPCFTRPRFELGLSSGAPQVSAKRFRLSCSLKSRVFSFVRHTCRHHPLHQCPSCMMPSTTQSCMDLSRVVWQLHLSWVEQGFLERFETDR